MRDFALDAAGGNSALDEGVFAQDFQFMGRLATEQFLAPGLGKISQIPTHARRDGRRLGGKLAQGVHGFSEKQRQSISKQRTSK